MPSKLRRAAVQVRPAGPADLPAIVRLASALWPEDPASGHRAHMRATLAGEPRSTLPLTLFVAEHEGRAIGFAEVGLRSHADGCDGRRAVGYMEGWYVEPAHRRRGVGRALFRAAERWAMAQGCREMASDTWLHSKLSQRAHLALGYQLAERAVLFHKTLRR